MSASNPEALYPELDWPAGTFAVKKGVRLFAWGAGLSLLGGLWGLVPWASSTPLQLLGRLIGIVGLLGLAGVSLRVRGWLREPLDRSQAEIDPEEAGELAFLPDSKQMVVVVVDARNGSRQSLDTTLQALKEQKEVHPDIWVVTAPNATLESNDPNIHLIEAQHFTQGIADMAWQVKSRYLAFLRAGDQPTDSWLGRGLSYLERTSRDGLCGPAGQDLTQPAGWLAHGWEQFFPLAIEGRRQARHNTLLLPPQFSICRRKSWAQAFNQVPDKKTPLTWWDLSVALLRNGASLTLSKRPLGNTPPPASIEKLAERNLQEARELICALRHSSHHRSLTPPARGDLLAVAGRNFLGVAGLAGLLGSLLSGSWVMFSLALVGAGLIGQGWKTVLEGAGGEKQGSMGLIVRYLWATLTHLPVLWQRTRQKLNHT